VVLAYDEVNALLIFGDTLGDTPLSLRNLARVLRDTIKLQKGTRIYAYFEGLGWFEGTISVIANDVYTGSGSHKMQEIDVFLSK
jgi:hypothetical protein